ncbi:hypothetical protein CCAX7_45960 [Capsulimonas corticalis]|uniref:Uncharacterized protein n=1 Tax=Capsulimonas corticalis TaxID=2219043 RepID=A0A402D542_9BACT|nr:hypothetical protein [Capsulimonas corticalis]BDI32545.1 hypothetical protein CCAX7_45960 [Capsulimonas corticalis]
MSQACYYHPARGIVSTCVECGIPLCVECTHRIDGSAACNQCAPTVQTNLQNAPLAAPYGAAPLSTNAFAATTYEPAGAAPQPYVPFYAPESSAGAINGAQSRMVSPGSVPLGLLFGAFIGLVGSILVLKILFYAHHGLSWLYIAVGYGIAYGITSVTRRGGVGLSLAAVGIMIFSLLVAHFVYAGDLLNEARTQGVADPAMTVLDALPIAMRAFQPQHWICVVVGLAACWRGAQQKSS